MERTGFDTAELSPNFILRDRIHITFSRCATAVTLEAMCSVRISRERRRPLSSPVKKRLEHVGKCVGHSAGAPVLTTPPPLGAGLLEASLLLRCFPEPRVTPLAPPVVLAIVIGWHCLPQYATLSLMGVIFHVANRELQWLRGCGVSIKSFHQPLMRRNSAENGIALSSAVVLARQTMKWALI